MEEAMQALERAKEKFRAASQNYVEAAKELEEALVACQAAMLIEKAKVE